VALGASVRIAGPKEPGQLQSSSSTSFRAWTCTARPCSNRTRSSPRSCSRPHRE
jgi:hypothetical protein